MSCGVGCIHSLDLELLWLWLWLWCSLAATAPFGPLAWEPPYAVGAALEKAKKKKKKKEISGLMGHHGLASIESNEGNFCGK